jgi:cell division septation protein DedD
MIAAFIAALALAVPASALAQGAGDEQYRDPFGGQQPEQPQQQPAQPQAPAGPAAGTEATPAQATPAPATSAQATGELPRTGFAGVVLLLAYGWALLVGGVVLRRVA